MSVSVLKFHSLPSSHAHARDKFAGSEALERKLQQTVRGEVRFDAGSRALYATDSSNYRQIPIGLVIPVDEADVEATLKACHEVGAPILPRGAGTSLAGQCCNVAVILDFSKYLNRIISLDPGAQVARVQPGIVLDRVRDAAEVHHLTFAPDPATHSRCTLGGMIGNNSCGVHALMGGKTVDNVHELDVMLYDGARMTVGRTNDAELESIIAAGGRKGQIYAGLKSIRDRFAPLIRQKFPRIPRRVSGYNLDELLPENGFNVARALVGSEGTCATILEATLRLTASPPFRRLVCIGFPNAFIAADHVPGILTYKPIGLEGFDNAIPDSLRAKGMRLDELRVLPEGKGTMLVEFGAWTSEDADAQAEQFGGWLATLNPRPNYVVCTTATGGTGVARARIGARRRGNSARQAARMGRLGGCGGAARSPGILPAHAVHADAGVRLRQPAVWPFRGRLRPHAHQLRPRNRAGHSQVPRVRRSRGGDRDGARWIDLGRARRWAGPRRACCRRCSVPS